MEWDGRYYVICHASSGNMYAFEVGESLDMAIPWGIFDDSLGVNGDKDQENDENYPDYGRAGAPCFMQDDDGVWHMFYEGGKRLHANIVHATGSVEGGEVNPPEPEEPDDGKTTRRNRKNRAAVIRQFRTSRRTQTDRQKR